MALLLNITYLWAAASQLHCVNQTDTFKQEKNVFNHLSFFSCIGKASPVSNHLAQKSYLLYIVIVQYQQHSLHLKRITEYYDCQQIPLNAGIFYLLPRRARNICGVILMKISQPLKILHGIKDAR